MLLIFFLIIGFGFLLKGADIFVDGASSLARSLKVSDLIIGLTVVAFGTSTPELFVNVFSSIRGNPEIAIGNVIGSNTANVLLILGISAVIYPLKVIQQTITNEIPLGLLAALLVFIVANDEIIDQLNTPMISRIDGLVLLAFFIIFVFYIFAVAKNANSKCEVLREVELNTPKSLLWIFAGLAALATGGHFVVKGAVGLAKHFNLSESLIGLTIVSMGTSLPELATSTVAAYKKKSDIAVGNIVGSNIFNIFFILGISATISPLPFSMNFNIDIAVMVLASFLLFLCMFTGGKRLIDRWEGIVFLAFYALYITFLINRG